MDALVVPALVVNRVRTKNLQFAVLNLGSQHSNHSTVFVLEEPSPRSGKDEQGRACMPKNQGLDVAMKFLTVGSVIFAVHRRCRDVGNNVCCEPKYLTR
jgi:hypothetical protein